MGAHASDGGRAKAGTALRCLVADARRFINDELWDRDLTGLPRMRRFVFSLSRVGIIVVKGFVADKCSLQASALTYITLMSMVPVLALALAGLKGLRAQDKLMEIIGLERLVIVEQAADAGSDAPPAERVEFAVVAGGRLFRKRFP